MKIINEWFLSILYLAGIYIILHVCYNTPILEGITIIVAIIWTILHIAFKNYN